MSDPAIKRLALGVLTAVLAGVALPVVFAQWNGKVNRDEYELHVQREEANVEAILDILCADRKDHRRCRR